VSVRQPRFAESCELGLARSVDPRLTGMLARLYDESVPRGETGRAASSADVERNLPATGLTRADLSWRSLLIARAELPELKSEPFVSDLLPAQGLAILRRDEGNSYVALDYGHSGGGHGHPDRLNLLLIDGQLRWFDDPGTGSYVEQSLHWYRSTLAHTAPLVDGRSQPRAHGALVAFQDDGHTGWMSAAVELLPGLHLRRSVVLLEDYLIDSLEWESDTEHEIALPLHGVDAVDARSLPLPRDAARIRGGDGEEDGFNQLRDGQRISVRTGSPVLLSGRRDGIGNATLTGWMRTPEAARWERALAPDVPSRGGLVPLLLVRAVGRSGRFLGVWSWRGSVASVEFSDESVALRLADGSRDEHSLTVDGWRIERERTGRCDLEVLGGFVEARDAIEASERHRDSTSAVIVERSPALPRPLPATFALGEPHYRRSEQSWREAGEPRATVMISRPSHTELQIDVEIPHSQRLFVAADAPNILDNEPSGINGDGVQLYLVAGANRGGWLLVPDSSSSDVRIRPIDEWSDGLEIHATWRATESGWSLVARVPLALELSEIRLDVIVNETVSGRARRRGQLVLSGAAGEFVYLRGDRHDPGRLLRFTLLDA
jgi:hypothetical protein